MNWIFLGAFCLVVSTLLIFRKELLNFYRIYSVRSMNPEDMTKHGLEFLKNILGDISKSNPSIEMASTPNGGSKPKIPLSLMDHPFIKKVKKEIKDNDEKVNEEDDEKENEENGETSMMGGPAGMINELFGSLKGLMEPPIQKTVLTDGEKDVMEFLEKRYNRKATLVIDSQEITYPILGARPVPDSLQFFAVPWKKVEDDEEEENESNESDGKRNDRIGGKVNDDEGIVFSIWKDETLYF